jgi:hypothetical protein
MQCCVFLHCADRVLPVQACPSLLSCHIVSEIHLCFKFLFYRCNYSVFFNSWHYVWALIPSPLRQYFLVQNEKLDERHTCTSSIFKETKRTPYLMGTLKAKQSTVPDSGCFLWASFLYLLPSWMKGLSLVLSPKTHNVLWCSGSCSVFSESLAISYNMKHEFRDPFSHLCNYVWPARLTLCQRNYGLAGLGPRQPSLGKAQHQGSAP